MYTNILVTALKHNADGTQYGFAVSEEDMSSVYIPTMWGNGLKIGDVVKAVLKPNSSDHHGTTPWFCQGIKREPEPQPFEPAVEIQKVEEPEPIQPIQEKAYCLDEEVLRVLSEAECFLTGDEIAERTGYHNKDTVRIHVARMHVRGEVYKLSLRKKASASRDTYCAYAHLDFGIGSWQEIVNP